MNDPSERVNIDFRSAAGDERAAKNALACTGPWQVEECLEVYKQWSTVYDEVRRRTSRINHIRIIDGRRLKFKGLISFFLV